MINQSSITNYDKKKDVLTELDKKVLKYLKTFKEGATATQIARHIHAVEPEISVERVKNTGVFSRLFKARLIARSIKLSKCPITKQSACLQYALPCPLPADKIQVYDPTKEEPVIDSNSGSGSFLELALFLDKADIKTEYKAKCLKDMLFKLETTGMVDWSYVKQRIEMYQFLNKGEQV